MALGRGGAVIIISPAPAGALGAAFADYRYRVFGTKQEKRKRESKL